MKLVNNCTLQSLELTIHSTLNIIYGNFCIGTAEILQYSLQMTGVTV